MHIDQVTLTASDLTAQRAFYAGVLGLPEAPAPSGAAAFVVGRSQLVIRQVPGVAPLAHIAFAAPAGSFVAARRWVAERTPLLADSQGADSFSQGSWDADAVYFKDPAGHILEVIVRRAPAGEPAAPTLLAICEAGLVVEDVPVAAAMFGARLGIAAFRGSVEADFSALGDEEGLLIVVRRGREWYPNTGVAAEVAVPSVTITTERGSFVLGAPAYVPDSAAG